MEDYPNLNRGKALSYVHTRCQYYIKNGVIPTVLNFSTTADYDIDGIKVISYATFLKLSDKENFEMIVCHAPNIKHHYKILKKYENQFKHIVLFFHGHEVLMCNKVYSKPYSYIKKSCINNFIRECYDTLKLKIWRNYFRNIKNKATFIFVSKWMENEFYKWTKVEPIELADKTHVIYNAVGEEFLKNTYDLNCEKKYNFITIRGNLDGSKYAVDIVIKLAESNPDKSFLIIGKGKIFNYYNKPANVIWLDKTLDHNEIINYLNLSKCALMPTRTDAQGLMMCEIATFGIPVITSDIEICHEALDEFENVGFIKNEEIDNNFLSIYNRLITQEKEINKWKYNFKNTVYKEIELIKNNSNK